MVDKMCSIFCKYPMFTATLKLTMRLSKGDNIMNIRFHTQLKTVVHLAMFLQHGIEGLITFIPDYHLILHLG